MPACLEDPDMRCLWDDTTRDCPCMAEDTPDGPLIETVNVIGELL